MSNEEIEALLTAAVAEARRHAEAELAALRAKHPLLSEGELVGLQAENRRQAEEEASRHHRQEEARLIRLDEEERHKPEYRRKLKQELESLDEEARILKRREGENGTRDEFLRRPRPEEDGSPEDLRETWRKEDRLGGYDPVSLEEFGQARGRMPSLEEIEDDHASELP